MNKLFLNILFTLFSFHAMAQNDSIYDCNVRLITKYPNCDSLRWIFDDPKVNYRKMLKKDRQLISFLNLYRSNTLTLKKLQDQINTINHYGETNHAFSDTIGRQLILFNHGLVSLLIRYRVRNDSILTRYYDLEINNPPGASYSRPLTYHYKIFKLLNFCLGIRYSCYNFEEEF
ncbi:hypothetical protein BH11BAC5_BH11BAC5_05780 [soil metagenome]